MNGNRFHQSTGVQPKENVWPTRRTARIVFCQRACTLFRQLVSRDTHDLSLQCSPNSNAAGHCGHLNLSPKEQLHRGILELTELALGRVSPEITRVLPTRIAQPISSPCRTVGEELGRIITELCTLPFRPYTNICFKYESLGRTGCRQQCALTSIVQTNGAKDCSIKVRNFPHYRREGHYHGDIEGTCPTYKRQT